jgi:ribonuclease HI
MTIDIYTDGACPGNGQRGGGQMGAGIVAKSGEFHREWAVPLGRGTNQKAELLAIKEALLKIRDRAGATVRVYTDSAYAIGCLTKNWKVKENADLAEEVRALTRECARFEMRKVLGHAGDAANERADELAVRAARTGEYYSGP